jgi:CHRD domain
MTLFTPGEEESGMKKSFTLLAGLVVLLSTLVASTAALAGPDGGDQGTMCVFNTQLRPENEFRPVGSTDPVDSTAHGHAQIKVRNDGTIEYKVHILNQAGELFRIGHIHRGAATVNGPVVVDLLGGGAGGSQTSDEHIVLTGEGAPNALFPGVATLCNNPAEFYVNFHTLADPVGAIRGQLP